ncbi:hypothetical protein HMPREF6123_1315 [Oribacterium sinus F0268]|uniref:Uncharacterized protein n=1 Tax=Oribacterium sinus F0268 TaxID=585501 RepID=C2KXU6_9FIRM|nr:hypothetical protein HMPREF6123_1315 [Oribacterium sinus F0268]
MLQSFFPSLLPIFRNFTIKWLFPTYYKGKAEELARGVGLLHKKVR